MPSVTSSILWGFFVLFVFFFSRAIILLLQQNKPECVETGKAAAVAACYFWIIKGEILAAVNCKKTLLTQWQVRVVPNVLSSMRGPGIAIFRNKFAGYLSACV